MQRRKREALTVFPKNPKETWRGGCSLALFLARKGARVTLVDQAAEPFAGASRWNEGKIHLGYLYAADPSLATARKMLPGGLAFRSLVEELVGCSIASAISSDDDVYLTHRESIIDPKAMAQTSPPYQILCVIIRTPAAIW
jgi:hypothetical protein